MNLYQEQLLDHYKNPRHAGVLENPTFTVEEYNPSCGDRVTVYGIIADGVLVAASFMGKGCVISQAASSMLLELMVGKGLLEIRKMKKDDILNVIGIELGPTRLRCAMLGLEALHRGISDDQE
ncbi:MAG: iron-sulfur cluster assembly scaffold protein [Candidatus Babeliales bacterium]